MIYLGVSGWIYPSWRQVFYPAGLPHQQQLAYASQRFNSIEVNSTFYSLKSPSVFRRWRAETPAGFVFALKGGRFITHMKQLGDPEVPLANFFASGVLALGPKLGPILWQLPERLRFAPERLERFLGLLPRDTVAAAQLARRHDGRVTKGTCLEPGAKRPIRHAIEARHESFAVPGFVDCLRRARVALVVSDAPAWPRFEEVTADFVYVRLHGAQRLYESGYDEVALTAWAARVERWAAAGEPCGARRSVPPAPRRRARDVYFYFDNDARVRAPADAQHLAQLLEI